MDRPPRLPLFGPRRRPINAPGAGDAPAAAPAPVAKPAADASSDAAAKSKPSGPDAGSQSATTSPAASGAQAQPVSPVSPPPGGPHYEPEPRRVWPGVLAAVILVAGTVGVLSLTGVIGDGEDGTAPAPVPTETTTVPADSAPEVLAAASELGFPTFATRNTTRVGGSEPAANAAAVALATSPPAGESPPPAAVTLVDESNWQVALAATSLVAAPISAPVLFSGPGQLPQASERAIEALQPTGGPATEQAQVLAIGPVATPEGLAALEVEPSTADAADGDAEGGDAATYAVEIARLRTRLTGADPGAFVLVSGADPAYAVPAAGWAARSGDPILFTGRDELPPATRQLLAANPRTPAYVLGPESLVSESILNQLSEGGRIAARIDGPDPVTNAIEFARFGDGDFGWNINDPGHGLVVARAERPLDAIAAAPLSASGTWGPLLLTDQAAEASPALRGYLLDIKPGYRDDPTRALYNHVWIIGDQEAIELSQQATLDYLAELEQIGVEEETP